MIEKIGTILVNVACIFPFNFMNRMNIKEKKKGVLGITSSKTAVYWSFPVKNEITPRIYPSSQRLHNIMKDTAYKF